MYSVSAKLQVLASMCSVSSMKPENTIKQLPLVDRAELENFANLHDR
jgi:hypothetical protein